MSQEVLSKISKDELISIGEKLIAAKREADKAREKLYMASKEIYDRLYPRMQRFDHAENAQNILSAIYYEIGEREISKK